MKKLAFALLFFTSYSSAYVYNFGYRVHQADTDLRVHHFYYDQEVIKSYIVENMAGNDNEAKKDQKAEDLALLVNVISKNFMVDPLVFLGLIRMESAFYYTNNLSNSGAVGLTQFVQIGLKEVFSQLGFLSDSNATESSLNFFRSAYEKTRKEIEGEYSLVSFKALEKSLKSYNLNRWSDLNSFKSLFKNDTPMQVLFGAVFLKTLVGRKCDQYGANYCRNKSAYTNNNFKKNLLSFYKKALIGYNGEETPITSCPHEGRNLPVEQNFMRFCYAERITDWANKLDRLMEKSFNGFESKLTYVYLNRVIDQNLILNKLIDKPLYHKRVYQNLPDSDKRELNEGERCHHLDLKLKYTIDESGVDPFKQVYVQKRSYYVPHCKVTNLGSFLEHKKVILKSYFSYSGNYLQKIELLNPDSKFRFSRESTENLEVHFFPRVSKFIEKDLFLDNSYLSLASSSLKVDEVSEGKLKVEAKLEGLDPKSFNYQYYKVVLLYDQETRKFTSFESFPLHENSAAN